MASPWIGSNTSATSSTEEPDIAGKADTFYKNRATTMSSDPASPG
jgi:hypothetical protein